MATSNEKVRELLDIGRRDRGKLGLLAKVLMIPPLSGEVRELLRMPTEQLDQLLDDTVEFVSALRSDGRREPCELHGGRSLHGLGCGCPSDDDESSATNDQENDQ